MTMTFKKRPLRRLALAILAVFAFATFAAAQEEDEDEAPERSVTLDSATVGRLGIETAPLEAAQFRPETNGYGVVMAFDALAQTDADLTTAESAAQTSQAARTRARELFAAEVSVSRQTLEAAERQSAADAAQLALAQRRAIALWGSGVPWRNPQERSRLLGRLAAGDVALARVTFPSTAIGDGPPASLRIQRLDAGAGAAGWTATTIWSAPADPTVPGRSFFALVERARGLSPGERLLVFLPEGRSQQGVVIPSAALLIAEGQAWYYAVEIVPLIIPMAPFVDFTRQMLDISRPTAKGYFVPDGSPGQSVVVQGAGLLLAREIGPAEED
jgi:hypothetical protein